MTSSDYWLTPMTDKQYVFSFFLILLLCLTNIAMRDSYMLEIAEEKVIKTKEIQREEKRSYEKIIAELREIIREEGNDRNTDS